MSVSVDQETVSRPEPIPSPCLPPTPKIDGDDDYNSGNDDADYKSRNGGVGFQQIVGHECNQKEKEREEM